MLLAGTLTDSEPKLDILWMWNQGLRRFRVLLVWEKWGASSSKSLPFELCTFSQSDLFLVIYPYFLIELFQQAYGFISDYAHLRFEDKEVHLPKYLLLFNIKLTTNQLTWPRSRAGTRQSQSSFQLVHCSHVGWPFNPGNKPGGRKRPCPFSFRWPWCSSFASKVV